VNRHIEAVASQMGVDYGVALTELHNAGMAKTLAQRQADFRKAMKDAGFVLLTAYVTKEQRDKFRQIGGDEWLRERINKAKPKEKE
jgi:ribosomal protein S9